MMRQITAFAAVARVSMRDTADESIIALCETIRPAFLRNLELLVSMDSGSDDYDDLNAKAAVLRSMLESAGGRVVFVEAAPPRGGTSNIVAVWKGTGRARVMYMAHYDTVWPKGEAARRPFYVKDNIAYGPGVNDCLSSVAGFPVFMEALLNEMGCRNFDTITIMLNADEEVGSFGSRDLIMRLAAEHDVVYSADGFSPDSDEITTASRGTAFYEMFIQGVKTCTDAAPGEGCNAGYELAYQILKMRDLSNKKRGVDVHWTMGRFGARSDTIPREAYAHANARVTYREDFDRIENDIRERIKETLYPESHITLRVTRGRPPFEPNAATDALAAKIKAISEQELGRPLRAVPAGFGNDTSFSYQTAPAAIDGFTLGGYGAHSLDEHYDLSHFVPRMYLWLRVAQETMAGNMVPLIGKFGALPQAPPGDDPLDPDRG